jgi:hypothetical protein
LIAPATPARKIYDLRIKRDAVAEPTEIGIMQTAKFVIGVAALVGVTAAYADGFVITRDIANGREMRLFEHAAACNAGPGAFVYRHGTLVTQTCNVRITASGATVVLPAFNQRVFFPRDTLYMNSDS